MPWTGKEPANRAAGDAEYNSPDGLGIRLVETGITQGHGSFPRPPNNLQASKLQPHRVAPTQANATTDRTQEAAEQSEVWKCDCHPQTALSFP